ncbi:MAG: DUF488 domain-containing protein [Deltaproteobacteria bacterium]|nr:DUF488 domain-containing protein [Candidatus Zymogenaceae bacterium]
MPVVWTIGHSNMEIDDFLGLLHTHGIRCVVDVRSAPYSRHVPHFNRTEIKRALESAGIRYLFMGDALGGRIKDEDGARPRTYAQAIADPSFHSGIDTLLNEAGEAHTAVMCAEKDPNRCHRRHIIAAVLDERDVTVRHILSDGKTVTERELMGLFGKKT